MQSSVFVEIATPRTKDRGADLFVALLKSQGCSPPDILPLRSSGTPSCRACPAHCLVRSRGGRAETPFVFPVRRSVHSYDNAGYAFFSITELIWFLLEGELP